MRDKLPKIKDKIFKSSGTDRRENGETSHPSQLTGGGPAGASATYAHSHGRTTSDSYNPARKHSDNSSQTHGFRRRALCCPNGTCSRRNVFHQQSIRFSLSVPFESYTANAPPFHGTFPPFHGMFPTFHGMFPPFHGTFPPFHGTFPTRNGPQGKRFPTFCPIPALPGGALQPAFLHKERKPGRTTGKNEKRTGRKSRNKPKKA